MPAHPPPGGRRRGSSATSAGRTAAVLVIAVAGLALVLAAGVIWLVRDFRSNPASPHCMVREETVSFQFSPPQSRNAATISLVADDLRLPRRAVTIAQATAIQESGLRNLDYGDRDSVGLFQQRPSMGWGTAAQIQDPAFSARAFYEALTKIDGWQTGELTVVAQAVQRSAYPDAYAEHEWEARVLSAAFTGARDGEIGCLLAEPDAPGEAQDLADALERESRYAGTVAGRTVVVDAPDAQRARAIGAWAVASAAEFGATEVSVGSRVWRRSGDEAALRWNDGTATPETRVTVRFD